MGSLYRPPSTPHASPRHSTTRGTRSPERAQSGRTAEAPNVSSFFVHIRLHENITDDQDHDPEERLRAVALLHLL